MFSLRSYQNVYVISCHISSFWPLPFCVSHYLCYNTYSNCYGLSSISRSGLVDYWALVLLHVVHYPKLNYLHTKQIFAIYQSKQWNLYTSRLSFSLPVLITFLFISDINRSSAIFRSLYINRARCLPLPFNVIMLWQRGSLPWKSLMNHKRCFPH